MLRIARLAHSQSGVTAGCLLVVLLWAAGGRAAGDEPSDWRTARRTADEQFRERLAGLADKCDSLDLPREARFTRQWQPTRDPGRTYVFPLAAADPTQPGPNADKLALNWYAKFREHRAVQADALFAAARLALAAHEPTAAYQLLHEVLRENPDHPEARRILGASADRQPNVGREARVSKPRVDHARVGWRKGQYWRAESAHFRIATNHSESAATDVARKLEEVYAVWRQVFFSFWSREEALAARLAGGNDPLGPTRQHDVVLFRERGEYVSFLQPSQPKIDVTLGIYLDEQRAAYLYVGSDGIETTWRHEVAHQLFQETEDLPPGVGAKANFWAAEAAALYFESLRKFPGYFTVGGKDADRLQFARYRILRDDYYLPLDQLTALGRDQLQQHVEIRKLYGQSAALAHLLLDGDGGREHEQFVRYLSAVYANRAEAGTLGQMLGQTGPAIDRRLRDWLQVTDAEIAAWPSSDALRNLSLGRTQVSDAALAHLGQATKLQWLDLSSLPVTDGGLANFRPASSLKQLFLEQTKISDEAQATLASFKDLEELDLSYTAVTDRLLARVGQLKRLQKLHLTGCRISDQGLAHLKNLKQLDTLEVADTDVTPAGLAELKRSLPKLAP